MFFLKLLIFFALLFSIFYCDLFVAFPFSENLIEIHVALFAILFLVFISLILAFFSIKNWFFKKRHEKGIKNLEKAFSYMLLKDAQKMKSYISKSRKVLGDSSIVNWLEGQFHILNNDPNKAKAVFYKMVTSEESALIGNYSLYKIYLKNGSEAEAIDSIDAILRIDNKSPVVIQAIYILLKNKRFDLTQKYLSAIRRLQNSDLIEAAIYFEDGVHSGDIELIRKSYKLAPELIKNSIFYADYYIGRGEYKDARKILRKTFEKAPHQEIFQKFVFCDTALGNLDKIKLAEKLISANPDSWIGYYGLGKLLIKEEMYQAALSNFQIAYGKADFDFILDDMLDAARYAQNHEILSRTYRARHVEFLWKCKECSNLEAKWEPVCDYCKNIATYEYVAEERTVSDVKFLGASAGEPPEL